MSETCRMVEEITHAINSDQTFKAETKIRILTLIINCTLKEVKRLKEKIMTEGGE